MSFVVAAPPGIRNESSFGVGRPIAKPIGPAAKLAATEVYGSGAGISKRAPLPAIKARFAAESSETAASSSKPAPKPEVKPEANNGLINIVGLLKFGKPDEMDAKLARINNLPKSTAQRTSVNNRAKTGVFTASLGIAAQKTSSFSEKANDAALDAKLERIKNLPEGKAAVKKNATVRHPRGTVLQESFGINTAANPNSEFDQEMALKLERIKNLPKLKPKTMAGSTHAKQSHGHSDRVGILNQALGVQKANMNEPKAAKKLEVPQKPGRFSIIPNIERQLSGQASSSGRPSNGAASSKNEQPAHRGNFFQEGFAALRRAHTHKSSADSEEHHDPHEHHKESLVQTIAKTIMHAFSPSEDSHGGSSSRRGSRDHRHSIKNEIFGNRRSSIQNNGEDADAVVIEGSPAVNRSIMQRSPSAEHDQENRDFSSFLGGVKGAPDLNLKMLDARNENMTAAPEAAGRSYSGHGTPEAISRVQSNGSQGVGRTFSGGGLARRDSPPMLAPTLSRLNTRISAPTSLGLIGEDEEDA